MKKVLCILTALLLLLCGCSPNDPAKENFGFIRNDSGNIVSKDGVEYTHLANEGILYYIGDLEFSGSIQGEEKSSQHLGMPYQTGMFAIKNAENDNILIRFAPDSEWFAVYRKASLPTFDFSVDNCIRLEFVSGTRNSSDDAVHTTSGDGIADQSEITAFLSEVRSQKSPREAGLYDLVRKPDGMLENCYIYGVIYGFFEEESNLAVCMNVSSYNDLAYSVSIEGKEYVLPTQWLEKLQNK